VAEVAAAGEGGVAVRFAEGGAAEGVLLVGADGLWSRLRALLAPGHEPRPTGVTAARTVIPLDAVLEAFSKPVTGVWLAPDSHVVHYPVHGGRSLAVVAIAPGGEEGHGWNREVTRDVVAARFTSLPASLAALLGSAAHWRQWALRHGGTVFDVRDRAAAPVVLIGDAAHPIQPFLAQGGAMAIEDGWVLADLLAETSGDVAATVAGLEEYRRRRVEAVQAASLENGRIYHLSGAARTTRNAVLGLTPGALLMRRYDWLYGWRPAA